MLNQGPVGTIAVINFITGRAMPLDLFTFFNVAFNLMTRGIGFGIRGVRVLASCSSSLRAARNTACDSFANGGNNPAAHHQEQQRISPRGFS
jgi:hypothetical protein